MQVGKYSWLSFHDKVFPVNFPVPISFPGFRRFVGVFVIPSGFPLYFQTVFPTFALGHGNQVPLVESGTCLLEKLLGFEIGVTDL